jgi:hypothetical protein
MLFNSDINTSIIYTDLTHNIFLDASTTDYPRMLEMELAFVKPVKLLLFYVEDKQLHTNNHQ